MYDVLCTGLTCCDLIFPKLEAFPALGKEVASENFLIKPGGASNTPVALTKLGVKTIFSTIIGADELGRIIYEALRKSGLDMSAVVYTDKFRTTVSAVLSTGKDRGFATYFAENGWKIIMEQVERFAPQCSHIHTYIRDCLEIPMVEIAKKYNKTISIDAAWDESITLDKIKHIIQNCDLFFANEIEACSIAGTGNAEEALEVIGQYIPLAVVKLGAEGSIVKQGSKVVKVPAVRGIEVVDTTGAGDIYSAGFIYGYIKGWDIEKTARFASASGGLAVTFYGGVDDAYTLEAVSNFFDNLEMQI